MIVLMGVAGAGKSSQGRMLADERGYAWISTGAILRVLITGRRRQEMLTGKLLTDTEVIGVVNKTLEFIDVKKEFILDGFPRTITQADWLLTQIESGRMQLTVILNLKASENVVRKRLLKRGRQDDNDITISERFKEYHEQTMPILQHLSHKGLNLIEIDANLSIEEIHKQILAAVDAASSAELRG